MAKRSLIQDIIEYCIVSARLGELVLEQENKDQFKTRLQLHVLIDSSFGSTKSSFFRTVEQMGLGIRLTDYSMPALVGTIKKSGEVVEGFVIKASGQTLIIDEFQKFGKREKEALLSLMEDLFYRRTLGFKVAVPVSRQGDFYKIVAEENWLEVHVKESFMIGAMYFRKKSMEDLALLNRAFPIVLDPTPEDLFSVFTKGSEFRISKSVKKIRDKLSGESVFLPYQVAKYLQSHYKKVISKFNVESGFILRGLMDITRIAGINALMNGDTEITDEHVDRAMKYATMQMLGYSLSALSPSAVKVYTAILESDGMINQEELVNITGFTRQYIIRLTKELREKGLIEIQHIGREVYYFCQDEGYRGGEEP